MGHNFKLAVFILLGTLLLSFLAPSGYCRMQSEKLPKMYIHRKTADLGEFYEGVDIKYAFAVRNYGAGELRILGVKPG